MSRRRQPNPKHGRKRPDSIAPLDDQSVGQNDASVPGVDPTEDASVAVARRSDELPNDRTEHGHDSSRAEHDNGAPSSAASNGVAPDRRPKTPPVIDPDAPTSVLPASELPARDGASHSGSRTRMSPGDATGFFARQPTPQPGEAIAVPKICPHCGGEYETDARFCPKDGTALRPKGGGDALVGRVIADRYHVLKVVGEGGMGRIYLAEHVRMNRQCALKVMRPNLLHDADSAARFGREASNAARIIHPNVAAVFDYGETEGLVYLVMEYVDGEPLGEILQKGGALKPYRAVEIAKQVADALTAAHELGIVHRDLKPDNIIVTKSKSGREVAKVVDFGIAKAMIESPDRRLTETGLVIGTPEFMSPEQLVGDPADARSDIYSLGCIFYLMLVGSPAADAPTRDAMFKRRLNELPPHPSRAKNDLPPELDAIVVRMLAVRPDDRFQTAGELRAALDEIRLTPEHGSGITTSGATVMPRSSLDPSKAPTVEAPVAEPLPSWMPSWMAGMSARRTARTALTVAGVALVGGAAVGAALTIAMRQDPVARPDSLTARRNVGASAGAPSGTTTRATAPAATVGVKSIPGTDTAPGAAVAQRPAPSSRSAQPSTSRGAPGVASRARADDSAAERSITQPRAPALQPEYNPAMIPIRNYAAAVQSGDVQRIRQVYPGLTAAEQKRWEGVFKESKVKATVQSPKGLSIDPAAGTAVVQFDMNLSFIHPTTLSQLSTTRQRYVAWLRRQGQVLRIERLQLR
jgi:eukaryotic-like serine/threonine-protein kinase